MPPNNNLQEDNLTPAEIRLLLSDLNEFKKTFLYRHYKTCHKLLMDETVLQILDEPLTGPETLYAREGWIGEARGARQGVKFFDALEQELQLALKEIEQQQ